MPKRVVYTKITPLAANIPRQLALDMLHSHGEIIELNPLVTGHKPIPAPRDASRDEFFAQWYEIEEILTWGLGMRKKISFKGVFHDMPWGLQTHIYAPMGVDLRNKYMIAGNEPGEPREAKELGIDTPADGLYLREDVEIVCNVALAGFVKKETKQTLLTMIERMTKKAELLDDGVLEAMFANGKLKTRNPGVAQPGDKLSTPSTVTLSASSVASSPASPTPNNGEFLPSQTFTKYANLPGRSNTQRNSVLMSHEMYAQPDTEISGFGRSPSNQAVEMEGSSTYHTADGRAGPPVFHAELADTSTASDAHRPSVHSTTSRGSLEPNSPNLQTTGSFRSQHSNNSVSSTYSQPYAIPAPLQPDSQARSPRLSNNYVIKNPDHAQGHLSSLRSSASYEGQHPAQQASPPTAYQSQGSPPYPTTQPASSPGVVYQPYNRASTTSVAGADKLANQVGGLNISGAPQPAPARVESNDPVPPKTNVKCPICGVFEGDSTAVSHHVNRWHFQ